MSDELLSDKAVWPAQWVRSARRKLVAWYRQHARDLSWRRTSDPYAIWVSEIMLQQTQVATVEKYFSRFLEAFPTIAALAAAPEDRVLRLWEGLGYYRRARQLHRAAKVLVEHHNGEFPSDPEIVRSLPGIGRYTAGAILSIAFDDRQPILEANTIRLYSRLLAFAGDTASREGQKILWQAAESLLPKRGSGEINQALMELGSLVCTPRQPNCGECPLHLLCPTQLAGLQESIPAPRPQAKMTELREAAVIVSRRGKVLIRKCQPGERWAGLWDFPRFALPTETIAARKSRLRQTVPPAALIVRGVRELTNVSIGKPTHFTTLRHGVTRFRITLDAYFANCLAVDGRANSDIQRWVAPAELGDYPLSVTGRKLAEAKLKQPAGR